MLKPRSLENVSISLSHGVVRIAKESGSQPWWFMHLDKNFQLGQEAADTMCRQMGYTNAVLNSVMDLRTSRQFGHVMITTSVKCE